MSYSNSDLTKECRCDDPFGLYWCHMHECWASDAQSGKIEADATFTNLRSIADVAKACAALDVSTRCRSTSTPRRRRRYNRY